MDVQFNKNEDGLKFMKGVEKNQLKNKKKEINSLRGSGLSI
jgi:hypothetical protein